MLNFVSEPGYRIPGNVAVLSVRKLLVPAITTSTQPLFSGWLSQATAIYVPSRYIDFTSSGLLRSVLT